ncbi:MAG: hypothetical protein ABSF85_11055, partial [Terriglobales bacterium]
MKRCVLRWLLLLLAAGSLRAEQAPPTPASDAIFLWLAGGISSARIQRLIQSQNAQTRDEVRTLSCQATPLCTRALQKAGADSGLIQSLVRQSPDPKTESKSAHKTGRHDASCACSSPAAQVAALVHEKKFDAAEDKIRALLRDDAENAALHFVLGTVLRREDRFDDALDEITESSRLMPGFPETHSQFAYLFYRT